VAGGFAALTGTAAAAPASKPRPAPGTDFDPVPPNKLDAVTLPDGYAQRVVIRWGDPVVPGAPKFDFTKQTATAQAKQFGYNNDFVGLIPRDALGLDNLLVVNHEYTAEVHLFPADQYDPANPTEEQVKIAWAAHGLSVLRARRDPIHGGLEVVPSRFGRRITLDTVFEVRGPAAGSKYLKTSADPTGRRVRGTQNNCSGGVTPWGTVLSGEENIHQYFANSEKVTDPVEAARLKRYAIGTGASTRKWERFDKRWDVAQEPNEPNRFGWVVEIDPNDPNSTPVKHTALGRFKHEGSNIKITADGRVAAYSGDDERFEYIYKFVSKGKYKPGRSATRVATTRPCSTKARCTSAASPATARPRRSTAPASSRRTTSSTAPASGSPWPPGTSPLWTDSPRRRSTSSRGRRPTRSPPRRWTARRTSSRTRSTAGSTRP
jgi:secreted PhoX family phosphatase